MTSLTTPPPSAERLLRLSIRDLEWRDAVTGDLREDSAEVARRRGVAVARQWYWRQSLALTARFAAGRVTPAVTPTRRTGVAELEAMSLGSGWLRKFRHAWRALWQRPGLSTVIVGTLALALTANAVIFNLADALCLVAGVKCRATRSRGGPASRMTEAATRRPPRATGVVRLRRG